MTTTYDDNDYEQPFTTPDEREMLLSHIYDEEAEEPTCIEYY